MACALNRHTPVMDPYLYALAFVLAALLLAFRTDPNPRELNDVDHEDVLVRFLGRF